MALVRNHGAASQIPGEFAACLRSERERRMFGAPDSITVRRSDSGEREEMCPLALSGTLVKRVLSYA